MLSTTKITIFLAAAVLLAQAACAENVLSASLVICNNDTIRLNHLILEDGYPTKYTSPGDHRIELVNTQGEIIYNISLGVNFILFSDPPVRVNCSLISIRVPYDAQMRRINIYRKENLIYTQELKLCNNNAVCDLGYETHLSCPGDCLLNAKDGICTKEKEGICDPDCAPGADPDCTTTDNGLWMYLALFLIILAAIIIYKKRKRTSGSM